MSLIKAIFEKNKILQAQIDLQKDLSSQGGDKPKKKRRAKKVREDPSIMSEYNNIDAYLAQSMMGSRLNTQVMNALASDATLQEFPGHHNHSLVN